MADPVIPPSDAPPLITPTPAADPSSSLQQTAPATPASVSAPDAGAPAAAASAPTTSAPPEGGTAPAAAASETKSPGATDPEAAPQPTILQQFGEPPPKDKPADAPADKAAEPAAEKPKVDDKAAEPPAEKPVEWQPQKYEFKWPETIKPSDEQVTELSTLLNDLRVPADKVQGLADLHGAGFSLTRR